ncbi:MAG: hypothetical protein CMO65_06540, partial [Verrucomicrobiales bacterium]|nr:hypothetical protein [Verrucomicrobiales bacterium]
TTANQCLTLTRQFLELHVAKVSFEYAVDWEKVEAQAEAEFAAQRARLARRVDDADYPFPEILDYVAGVVVRDFR